MAHYTERTWTCAPAVYDEHTLKINGKEVMEDWEQGYMQRLAATATRNGGAILELGFGMGISATAVQSHGLDSHTVIECHPDVAKKCITDFSGAIEIGRMRLLVGFWQNITPMLASAAFDGILFDTYPIKDDEFIGPHMWFFKEAHRLLKPGGTLTYYSDEATDFSEAHLQRLEEAGFDRSNIGLELCEVTPPPNCEYWNSDTFVVPIVTKPRQDEAA